MKTRLGAMAFGLWGFRLSGVQLAQIEELLRVRLSTIGSSGFGSYGKQSWYWNWAKSAKGHNYSETYPEVSFSCKNKKSLGFCSLLINHNRYTDKYLHNIIEYYNSILLSTICRAQKEGFKGHKKSTYILSISDYGIFEACFWALRRYWKRLNLWPSTILSRRGQFSSFLYMYHSIVHTSKVL